MEMTKKKKIYIAGHKGMVGSAIVQRFETEGYENIVIRSLSDLDLREQIKVRCSKFKVKSRKEKVKGFLFKVSFVSLRTSPS